MGGGDSRLVDHLLAEGFTCLTVLDVSRAAIDRARARVGPGGDEVRWVEGDVTAEWQVPIVDIWHDRAVFHFLTDPADRQSYVTHVGETVRPGGHIVIGTFAADGPERCSGLPVQRYSPELLAAEFRNVASPIHALGDRHITPSGVVQPFTYLLLRVD